MPQLLAIALHRLKQTSFLQPDFPFRADRVPVFYGWVILIVTTLGVLMSIPGQTAGVSVFTDPLLAATGLSRLSLSNAYFVGTLTSGLLLPFGGAFVDRFGARLVVVAASIWLGLTLIYLSMSDRIAQWVAIQFALDSSVPIAFGLLCLGFISLRFSGQGMLTLVSQTTLGKWFDRRRGMASGTAGIFLSFGFSSAPLLLSFFIEGLGWRGAWLCLAVLVGLGMGTVGWLFYRDNPEECGLVMDGRGSGGEALKDETNTGADILSKTATVTQPDFTRQEALRTLAFWAVTLALASQSLTITGITFHIVDIGTAAGLSRNQTVAIFLPIGFISTGVGYFIGIASDRLRLKVLYITMMLSEAIGVASMAHLDSPTLRWLAILGQGFTGGCFGTLSTVTMPRYFGRQHLGAIAGVSMMTLVIGSAIGPSLLATFNALFGNYRFGLYLCASIPLAVLFLLIPSGNPRR